MCSCICTNGCSSQAFCIDAVYLSANTSLPRHFHVTRQKKTHFTEKLIEWLLQGQPLYCVIHGEGFEDTFRG